MPGWQEERWRLRSQAWRAWREAREASWTRSVPSVAACEFRVCVPDPSWLGGRARCSRGSEVCRTGGGDRTRAALRLLCITRGNGTLQYDHQRYAKSTAKARRIIETSNPGDPPPGVSCPHFRRAIARLGPGASMEELANEVGITKPVLYKHFGSRAGLAEALTEQYLEDFHREVTAALQDVPNARAFVRTLLSSYFGFVERHRAFVAFIAIDVDPRELAEGDAHLSRASCAFIRSCAGARSRAPHARARHEPGRKLGPLASVDDRGHGFQLAARWRGALASRSSSISFR